MTLYDFSNKLKENKVNVGDRSISVIYSARVHLVNFAKGNDELYIYGAGKWGMATAILLDSFNIKISGFVVSKTDGKNSVLGYKVVELSVLDVKNVAVIIGIASRSVASQIQTLLREKKAKAIFSFGQFSKTDEACEILGPVTGDIKFSILMPVYNVDIVYLGKAIDSVLHQNYQNWELCMADDCSTDSRVIEFLKDIKDPRIHIFFSKQNKGISEATNLAASIATGDFFLFMDNDDVISPDALYWFYRRIYEKNADVVYSDMDLIDVRGGHFNPLYKPDWSPDLLRSQMYIGHLLGVRSNLYKEIGGCRKQYDGAQDYDLMLRIAQKTDKIEHIDKILYSWRTLPSSTASNAESKPYAQIAGQQALIDNLSKGQDAEHIDSIEETENYFVYDVKYKVKDAPLVSIVIPTKDHIDDLRKTIDSIYEKSTYTNYEVIILNNNSEEQRTYRYFEELKQRHSDIIIEDASYDFNWSRICNHGIQVANGSVYIMLNNDVEVISPDWIERLASNALRPNVGVVGALLLYPDGTIQHGGVLVGFGGWADHLYKGMLPVHCGTPFISPVVTRNVSAVTGACMAFSRETYNKVGKFDEEYIICGSDVEFCLRAIKKGLYNIYNPHIRLYHFESKTRKNIRTPEIDLKLGFQLYKWYRENGDPFYNNNLNYQSLFPTVAECNLRHITIERHYVREILDFHFRKMDFTKKRINLLIPSINETDIAGGISTAIHIFKTIVNKGNFAARVIVTNRTPDEKAISDWGQEYKFVAAFESSDCNKQILTFSSGMEGTIPVSKNDYFMATVWWTAYAIQKACDSWNKSENICNPIIYLIQDYEPGFYAWSAKYLLADATYKTKQKQIAIFNSKLLYDFFKKGNYVFYKEYYFDPILNESLKKVLKNETGSIKKERTILVYGRPNTPRNSWPLLLDGLKMWSSCYAHAKAWRIVSAGQEAETIELNNDVIVENVGKLSLSDYAAMLKTAYVGISLMVSPHPSYPPLEMAAFGVKVITNRFSNKNLETFSKNIISLESITPENICDALCDICDSFTEQFDIDIENCKEYIMGNNKYPFLNELINDIKFGK